MLFFYTNAMYTLHEIEWRSQSPDCNTIKLYSTNTRTHMLVNPWCLCVCDFLQEVPRVTNLFYWPLGIRCSSLMAKPRREKEPPRARVMSSHRQSQAWAPSHTVHFHIVEGSSMLRFPLLFFWSSCPFKHDINPAESVKLACHIKMWVECLIHHNLCQSEEVY